MNRSSRTSINSDDTEFYSINSEDEFDNDETTPLNTIVVKLNNSANGSINYSDNIQQVNACRFYVNPSCQYKIENSFELYVKNIPREFTENEILGHFDRFGSIYKFRLLMDYGDCNRGYGYLKFHLQKSSALCIDVMNYFIPKSGSILQVEKSYAKYNLFALNIPIIDNNYVQRIKNEFKKIYPELCNVVVKKPQDPDSIQRKICTAVLEFPDHQAAIRAKKCGSIGSLHLWGRPIKIIWGKTKVDDSLFRDNARFLEIRGVPKSSRMTVDKFCGLITEKDKINHNDIVSVFPRDDKWLLECTSNRAAKLIMEIFQGYQIEDDKLMIGWGKCDSSENTKCDFDAELRLQCIANYWDPPVFLYGFIDKRRSIQTCAVFIKNNRKNLPVVFFVEIKFENLVEIHSRISEIIMKTIDAFGNLPAHHLVLKSQDNSSFLIGSIADLDDPIFIPTMSAPPNCNVFFNLQEMLELSKVMEKLINVPFNKLHEETTEVLKKDSEFLSKYSAESRILAVIDPRIRKARPLKYGLSNRQIILVSCDWYSRNNVISLCSIPTYENYRCFHESFVTRPVCLKFSKYSLASLSLVQRRTVHYSELKCVEFWGKEAEFAVNPISVNEYKRKLSKVDVGDPIVAKIVDDLFFGFDEEAVLRSQYIANEDVNYEFLTDLFFY